MRKLLVLAAMFLLISPAVLGYLPDSPRIEGGGGGDECYGCCEYVGQSCIPVDQNCASGEYCTSACTCELIGICTGCCRWNDVVGRCDDFNPDCPSGYYCENCECRKKPTCTGCCSPNAYGNCVPNSLKCSSEHPICNENCECVQCEDNQDCVDLGITCEDRGIPHRYAECRDGFCTKCGPCRKREHCEDGYCCTAEIPGYTGEKSV